MKAYTDLNQSKKLAELLPMESADMHYNNVSIKGINYVDEHRAELMEYNRAIKVLSKYTINPLFEVIPCWSLAALLGVLPTIDDRNAVFCKDIQCDKWHIFYHGTATLPLIDTERYHDIVDACYEMIIKLHEQNLL